MSEMIAAVDSLWAEAENSVEYWQEKARLLEAESKELRHKNTRLRAEVQRLAAQVNCAYGYGSDAGKPPWME